MIIKKLSKYKAHPWHGIDPGDKVPEEVTVFIEIVPTDTIKYEVDKASGYLSIDRPQEYSNTVPALYGFIPRTYCADRVAEIMNLNLGRRDIKGDGDPLDVCVLTEKDVMHGDIIAKVRPIGGLSLLDDVQADDKIIAVLKNDTIYSQYSDISQLPDKIVSRLVHYFTTYKNLPTDKTPRMVLTQTYGAGKAQDIIKRSIEDYDALIKPKL